MSILFQVKLGSGEITTTHEVDRDLAIGPAIHIPHMHKHGWSCMLIAKECTEDGRFPGTCTKIGLKDDRGNDLDKIIEILRTTEQWRKEGKKIMIACGAGRSRAPSVTAGHMTNCGLARGMMEALTAIHAVRPETNPNFGIMRNVQKALNKMREDERRANPCKGTILPFEPGQITHFKIGDDRQSFDAGEDEGVRISDR